MKEETDIEEGNTNGVKDEGRKAKEGKKEVSDKGMVGKKRREENTGRSYIYSS